VLREAVRTITNHVERTVDELDEEQVEAFLRAITDSEKVFIYGAGRSGLVGKAFAMRLMHLGINVFVVGEIITPAIEKNDVLITISGSGETTSAVNAARIAKKIGAKVAVITTYPHSSLGKLADITVVVRGRTKLRGEKDFVMRQIKGEHYPLAPLGTLFEVGVMIFLDAVIAELMVRLGKTEEEMLIRHASIE